MNQYRDWMQTYSEMTHLDVWYARIEMRELLEGARYPTRNVEQNLADLRAMVASNQKGVVEYGAVTITQGQIRITADRAVTTGVDFEDSKWQFSGTVRITLPDSAIASDEAEVKFSGGEILSAAVTGAPATFEQKRKDELARGRANRIDYDMKRG